MKKRLKLKKIKINVSSLIAISFISVLLMISVGFSSLSTSLTINGKAAFLPVGMIRVMSISQDSLVYATENNKSISSDTINANVDISSINGSATYNVVIKNLGQTNKQLVNIVEDIFTNEDMEYKLVGLNINDVIKQKSEVSFKVIFKYKDNVTNITDTRLNAKLKFVFEDYEPVNAKAYFKAYNGFDDLFGFSKANLISFSRNTDLTLAQVLAKSGVTLISNESDDEYNSDYPVYGWVENNRFYWWSEAETVYYHPQTLKAFSNFAKVVTVDLTGTDTSKVENFSHWFDKDRVLVEIIGAIDTNGLKLEYNESFDYANDNDENVSSEKGIAFMFNDCNALERVDLSKFNTTNSSDMKRVFGGCKKLKDIDISHFDTSNAKSMYWMFRYCNSMKEIDLRNFDTRKVENMTGMFLSSPSIKIITLGDNFDTSNVHTMTRMFGGCTGLTTIYAKNDFVRNSNTNTSLMFDNDSKLVGAEGTSYRTPYSGSYKNGQYAQIASVSQKGYFTLLPDGEKNYITYVLHDGTASNPTSYFKTDLPITLDRATKTGYQFDGWTGSNGNVEELDVVISLGTTGDLSYEAHFTPNTYTVIFNANGGTGSMDNQIYTYDQKLNLSKNLFTRVGYEFKGWNTKADGTGTFYADEAKVSNLATSGTINLYALWVEKDDSKLVFSLEGPCTFNGKDNNITGENCTGYLDKKYVDTGVSLFNSENYLKDFEISFDINNISSTQDSGVTQWTLLNVKYESSGAGYPGFVLRKSTSSNSLEITETIEGKKVTQTSPISSATSFRVVRKDGIIYYSFNGNSLSKLQDITNFAHPFTTPVTFGASLDADGNPFRYSHVTLSNMQIKLGKIVD